MNEYLGKLKNTPIKTLEDVVRFNDENRGSEGGHAGDLPAFPDGQRLFRKCVETKGIKDETYYAALEHIQTQCRQNGIDAALRCPSGDAQGQASKHTEKQEIENDPDVLDALLFFDIKAGGIQIAAQAGYPVMTIPIGLDPDGMPLPLTLQHTAWQEDKLIKWASAIEDLLRAHNDKHPKEPQPPTTSKESQPRTERMGRIPPTFKNHLRKNIPVDRDYQWPGRHREQGIWDPRY